MQEGVEAMKFQSAKANEASIKNKWLKEIKEVGIIKRVDLIKKLGLTTRQYERLTSYMLEEFEDYIEYKKENKRWYWIKKEKPEIPEEEAKNLV